MATITAVTVAGNLTRDPEIRYTREGQSTTSLSVAVNRRGRTRRPRSGRSRCPSSTSSAGGTWPRTSPSA